MPIGDWQFWVVSAVMIGALWSLKAVLLPKKKGTKTKTTLTVGGQPLAKKTKRKSKDCGCS